MKSAALTDIGLARKINQDYLFQSDEPVGKLPNLYIIADGMGGHKAGDYASSNAVREFVEFIKTAETMDIEETLQAAAGAANSSIYEASIQNKEYEGMGTTLVVCVIENRIIHVLNIGDSRLYILGNDLIQVTNDHSLVEEMKKAGNSELIISEAGINKNIITKAVGVAPKIEADYFVRSLSGGEKILLCSDGLTNMIDDEKIKNIIRENDESEKTVLSLVESANKYGGYDNVSAIIIYTD